MTNLSVLGFADLGLTSIGTLWIAIHLLGLLATWMVRMHDGQRYERFVQGGFFTLLLAVAAATVIGHVCCLEMWPLSAVTLALMVVLAIADLGGADAGATDRRGLAQKSSLKVSLVCLASGAAARNHPQNRKKAPIP